MVTSQKVGGNVEGAKRPTAGDEACEFTSHAEGGSVPPFIEKIQIMFDLQKISKLSRLNLSSSQIQTIEPQLQEILHYVESLKNVDTSTIEGHGLSESELRFREDEIVKQENPSAGVELSGQSRDAMFFVPKVIGGLEA